MMVPRARKWVRKSPRADAHSMPGRRRKPRCGHGRSKTAVGGGGEQPKGGLWSQPRARTTGHVRAVPGAADVGWDDTSAPLTWRSYCMSIHEADRCPSAPTRRLTMPVCAHLTSGWRRKRRRRKRRWGADGVTKGKTRNSCTSCADKTRPCAVDSGAVACAYLAALEKLLSLFISGWH